MKRFKYLVNDVPAGANDWRSLEGLLLGMGFDGWELVSYAYMPDGGARIILKMEVASYTEVGHDGAWACGPRGGKR